GIPKTFLQCLDVLKPENGTAIIASIFENEISLDANTIVFKYMSITGSMGYYPSETAEALDLIVNRKVDRDILITHRLPLDKAAEGFRVQGDSGKSVKVMIVV
ncbi:hypothetical protein LCGC14_2983550, partial [marine sediment metagenome]